MSQRTRIGLVVRVVRTPGDHGPIAACFEERRIPDSPISFTSAKDPTLDGVV